MIETKRKCHRVKKEKKKNTFVVNRIKNSFYKTERQSQLYNIKFSSRLKHDSKEFARASWMEKNELQ